MNETKHSTENPALTTTIREDVVLRLVLNSIRDYAVFNLDPHGVITTWNPGAEAVKGYTAEEAVGRFFGMLYLPEDRDAGLPQRNLDIAANQGEFHEEGHRLKKDGTHFVANVSINAIRDEHGELAGFIKVVRDVSERYATEKKIRGLTEGLKKKVLSRTAELQAANEDLEGFCYSIAHDLRAPLRAILASARMLQEDHCENVGPAGVANLDRMEDAARRMAYLVDDLLEFARIGRKEVKREPVDVSATAQEMKERLCNDCQGGSATFTIQDGMVAEADRELLCLVLDNLISNACKYSRPNVHIQIGNADIAGETVYYVRDDGIGFDMKFHDQLFRPFERLHTSEKYKGTGIGLANVERIIGRHGGKIWAQSAPGEGTTFFFTLQPASKGALRSPNPAAHAFSLE